MNASAGTHTSICTCPFSLCTACMEFTCVHSIIPALNNIVQGFAQCCVGINYILPSSIYTSFDVSKLAHPTFSCRTMHVDLACWHSNLHNLLQACRFGEHFAQCMSSSTAILGSALVFWFLWFLSRNPPSSVFPVLVNACQALLGKVFHLVQPCNCTLQFGICPCNLAKSMAILQPSKPK